jgi:hypothetical protein
MHAADWNWPGQHQTNVVRQTTHAIRLHRKLDADEYHAAFEWAGDAGLEVTDVHGFLLTPDQSRDRMEFIVAFSPRPFSSVLPSAPLRLPGPPAIGRSSGVPERRSIFPAVVTLGRRSSSVASCCRST